MNAQPMTQSLTPCEYAKERHRNFAKWRNLWSILLFAFGCALVLFLIGAILLFIRQDWITTALTALGTIADGVAVKWIVTRRTEAVKEEEEAYKDVESTCAGSDRPKAIAEVNQMATRLNLIGTFR
jgi:ABC-type branched-subunit amino acid transport system permease subunit